MKRPVVCLRVTCLIVLRLLAAFRPTSSFSPSILPPPATPSTTTFLLCQLLGMNCARPTDFSFSFQGFCLRGGETDIHADGWGLTFYQNNGLRQFHDDQPASQSPLADFVVQYPIRTLNMMSHIRYATHGQVDLANVHPFVREWAGIQWAFCHNGHIPLFTQEGKLPTIGDPHNNQTQMYHPVGSTDSEAAFCAILNALRSKYKTTLPSLPELYTTLQALCDEIVQYSPQETILNFLCTCGPYVLWVYSWPGRRPNSSIWNGLHYTVREPPFSSCHLSDMDYTVDFSLVTTEQDRVAVVATRPLTDDEEWVELQPGELIVFDEGLPIVSPQDLARLETIGHGLNTTVLPIAPLTEDLRRYEFKPSFHAGGGI